MPAALVETDGMSADSLFAEVYGRLKAMAARQRARVAHGHLATTELVHELYLRMGTGADRRFGDQAQFFAYAARAMRHILIDAARSALQASAGGDQLRVPLSDPAVHALGTDPLQALQLDAALCALAGRDARSARVVELHYFAGLSFEAIAELLDVCPRTVERDSRFARAFLASGMRD